MKSNRIPVFDGFTFFSGMTHLHLSCWLIKYCRLQLKLVVLSYHKDREQLQVYPKKIDQYFIRPIGSFVITNCIKQFLDKLIDSSQQGRGILHWRMYNTFVYLIERTNEVLFCFACNLCNWLKVIQPTISLEMSVPSQGHYGFHSFPVVD